MPKWNVRFEKGTDELDINPQTQGDGIGLDFRDSDAPYTLHTRDGSAYLVLGGKRHCWTRNAIGGAFPTISEREKYMSRINTACGERVAVAAEL